MNFYQEWALNQHINDEKYWTSFLLKEDITNVPLLRGSIEEIDEIINFIISIPIEYFVENVNSLNIDFKISSKDIPQFSSIHDATFGICKILNENNNLSYKEIGQRFGKTPNDVAWLKYGSEQGYLSTLFSLSTFEKSSNGKMKLSITALGKRFVSLTEKTRKELVKRLCYRFDFFQLLIIKLHSDLNVDLVSLFNGITGSTIPRRKSSVKKIIQIMFEDNSYDFLLKKLK